MMFMQKIPFIVTAPMMNYHSTFISSRSTHYRNCVHALVSTVTFDFLFSISLFILVKSRVSCRSRQSLHLSIIVQIKTKVRITMINVDFLLESNFSKERNPSEVDLDL